MLILVWYLCQRTLQATALMTLLFYGLFFVVGSLDYADSDLSFAQSAPIVAVDSLRLLSQFAVTILFFGFLLAVRNLVVKSQLIAIQASGVSLASLAKMFAVIGIIVYALFAVLSEVLLPLASQFDRHYRISLKHTNRLITSGHWLRSGDTFLRLQNTLEKTISGVQLLQFDTQSRLIRKAIAVSAQWTTQGITLHQAEITEFAYPSTRSSSEPSHSSITEVLQHTPMWLRNSQRRRYRLDSLSLPLKLNSQVFNYFQRQQEEFFLPQLWQYVDFLKANRLLGGSSAQVQFSLWQRLSQPLQLVGLMLLFLPSFLRSPRVQPMTKIWASGIAMGLLLYALNELLKNATLWLHVPNMLLALLLPLSLCALGIWRCRR